MIVTENNESQYLCGLSAGVDLVLNLIIQKIIHGQRKFTVD
jgi:hypothetical protein